MVSYGLAYGMEAYGLGQRLNIPTDEAAEILDAYFVAFPAVQAYMDRTVAEARERGYTETLFGRRRPIPELTSSNFRIRQAGERQAMNAGIQGLAADIFKVALVRLDRAAAGRRASTSRLILQVHDEVLLEVPPAEHDAVAELTSTVMAGAVELRVPLEVNLSFGRQLGRGKNVMPRSMPAPSAMAEGRSGRCPPNEPPEPASGSAGACPRHLRPRLRQPRRGDGGCLRRDPRRAEELAVRPTPVGVHAGR